MEWTDLWTLLKSLNFLLLSIMAAIFIVLWQVLEDLSVIYIGILMLIYVRIAVMLPVGIDMEWTQLLGKLLHWSKM